MNYRFLLTFIIGFFIINSYSQVCIEDGIELTTQAEIDSFPFNYPGCDSIYGDVVISGTDITNVDSLIQLTYIGGNLLITGNQNLINLEGLTNIVIVDGSLSVASNDSLTTIHGLHNVEKILGDFALKGNPLLDSLSSEPLALDTIWGNLQISNNTKLKSFNSLIGLTYINAIEITNNDSLINLIGLEGINTLKFQLDIGNNESLTSFEGLENLDIIGTYFSINGNTNLRNLDALINLKSIGTNFNLYFNGELDNIEGLSSLNHLNGLISISGNNKLTSLSGLDSIDVDGITYLEIFFNRALEVCNTPVICEYLSNCGVANIYKNFTTCEHLSNVQESCGLEITSYTYEESNCDSIVYQGIVYDQTGIYVQSIPSTNGGCDTTVTLFLNIPQSELEELYIKACDSFIFGLDTLYESGEYTFFGKNVAGCDSTVILYLQINGPTFDTIDITSCVSAEINGFSYTQSGSYIQDLVNTNGCDSTLLINVTINDGQPSHDTTYYYGCDVYIYNGDTIVQDTQWTEYFTNASLCDSTQTYIFNLTFSTFNTINVVDCGFVTVNGEDFFESGSYQQEFTNSIGCDSILTINVTILEGNKSFVFLSLSECESYIFNGDTLTEDGTYIDTLNNRFGCDSIITLNLNILDNKVFAFNVTVCESYTLNGVPYNETGVYTQNLLTEEGCDSFLILNLRILPGFNTVGTLNTESCGSTSINGITYTETGTYTQSLISSDGCDSILTINLVVYNSFDTIINARACEQYSLNDETFTESGIYQQFFQTPNGCDSNYILNLIINQHSSSSLDVSACDTYILNNQTFTESGIYTQVILNSAGCDSIITLDLTILDSNNMLTIFEVTACETYSYNGVTYDSTGRYIQKFSNSLGCDSSVLINLTILESVSDTIYSTSCSSFIINDSIYNATGVYIQNLTSSVGCDSFLYLYLTIYQPGNLDITATTCDSFEFNGFIYYQTGTFIQFVEDANGCDSTITIKLSILDVDNSIIKLEDTLYVSDDAFYTYQWIDCSVNLPVDNGNESSYHPSVNGSYACIINNGSCKDTTECISFVSSIKDEIHHNSVTISPNPNTGNFSINLDENIKDYTIKIFDQVGKEVKVDFERHQNTISVSSSLIPGVYTVTIEQAGQQINKRMIVVR